MTTHTDSFGRKATRVALRSLIGLLLVGLCGAVVILLSQLNAQTFRLEARDGKLVVMKGRLAPFGSEPYRPGDPVLADTYASLDLEMPPPAQLLTERYRDRDGLDRALFYVLEGLLRSKVTSTDPKVLDRALYYLRRAERLNGITAEQRLSLGSLRADLSFYLARGKLGEVQQALEEVLVQLRLAAKANGPHAPEATALLQTVEPLSVELERALRRRGDGEVGDAPPQQRTADEPPSAGPSPDAGPSVGGGAETPASPP